MKSIMLSICLLCMYHSSSAQLTMPENGGSVKGWAGEKIGITDVTIHYGRPGVRGREGKIWGTLVHEGFMDDASFGKPIKMPWRAGANENTTIEFSTDVMVEGKPLKAGKYGLHMAYGPQETIVIFSKSTEGWGSYFYDEADDALRVKVKPQPQDNMTERLTYRFSNETDSSAEVAVVWEKLAIPFTISTELRKLQLASIEREMKGTKTFNPNTYVEAASYYLENNMKLDEALQYAQSASRIVPTFFTYNIQRQILNKLNRKKEADSLMAAMVPKFSVQELNTYGRTLLREKEYKKAYQIMKMNYAKAPDNYVTCVGMMRGCSANGDYKKAIEYGNKAKANVKDDNTKTAIDKMITMLKAGKDINT